MFQLSEIIFCTFLDVPAIHSKSWWSDSADNLNFPQKDFLRTQKLSVWVPMNEEFWYVSQIKVKRCPNSLIYMTWFRSFEVLLSNYAFLDFYCQILLSRFTQIFLDWKSESADFFAFRMYGSSISCTIHVSRSVNTTYRFPLCRCFWTLTGRPSTMGCQIFSESYDQHYWSNSNFCEL